MKKFIIGIKNLIKYFKLIWKDRDWDYSYCEDILLFKLKEMQKQLILTKYPVVDWKFHKKEAQALKICINILKRRQFDWYINLYEEYKSNGEPKLYKINLIDKLEKRDWKLFCKLFEEYFQCWWD